MARAIIAGGGGLPAALHSAAPDAHFVVLDGVDATVPEGALTIRASFEKLGRLFTDLKSAGVGEVVFAGSMDRPSLNPAKFDLKMISLAPGLIKSMRQGDDALLRKVIAIFEGEGFEIIGPAEIAPGLTVSPGHQVGPKRTKAMKEDAMRGRDVLRALGPLDVGQAVVAASGQCLGIETLQGTDALLQFVGMTPDAKRGTGGVLVKWPKPGQDLRVDMPTIGPQTVEGAKSVGLKGICICAGQVLIIDPDRVMEMAAQHGLCIWAEEGPV